jgi:hypothetical protein
MALKRRFSLGFLFMEVTWIGIALGLFCAAARGSKPDDARAMFFAAGMLASGAAIGGLFGRMITGVYWTLVAFALLAIGLSLLNLFLS